MGRSYAEDTKVPVARSQEQIKKMLRELGSDRMAVFESEQENSILFEIPNADGYSTQYKLTSVVPEGRRTLAQRERASWRALVLLIKAKKVAIQQGITTVEKEFMGDTVMPGGATLIDYYQDLIAHNYSDGPPQIGWSGS